MSILPRTIVKLSMFVKAIYYDVLMDICNITGSLMFVCKLTTVIMIVKGVENVADWNYKMCVNKDCISCGYLLTLNQFDIH